MGKPLQISAGNELHFGGKRGKPVYKVVVWPTVVSCLRVVTEPSDKTPYWITSIPPGASCLLSKISAILSISIELSTCGHRTK